MSVQRRRSVASTWSNGKQIVVLSGFIAAVAVTHTLLPSARPFTKILYTLPYPQPDGQYLQGSQDVFFVLGWLVLLTALRAVIMESLVTVIAQYSHISRKARTRLAEQAWLMVYDASSFGLGMYIFTSSTYWLDFRELWSTWPGREISGPLKWYYLVQLAFWLQQLLTINLEQRRKDYAQMFTHHMVTCSLMYICYAYRWTKVGNVVLCIMDVVDFLLPLAKILKYLHFESACNVAFGVFLATWLVARHMIYPWLCWAIYRDVPGVMNYGCYSGATGEMVDSEHLSSWRYMEPFFDQKGTICLDKGVKWVFLSMLLMLQVLSIVWFGMILKVAYGVLKGAPAEDSRSGDEDELDDEAKCDKDPVIEEVKHTTSAKIRPSTSDGVPIQPAYFRDGGGGRLRIPRSRDRKEMIGRVGCNGSLD